MKSHTSFIGIIATVGAHQLRQDMEDVILFIEEIYYADTPEGGVP